MHPNILHNSRIGALGTLIILLGCGSDLTAQRETVDFDSGWRFAKGQHAGAEQPGFDDAQWRQIALPHDWSVEDLTALPAAESQLAITEGAWRFAKGDDMAWKEPNFDDSGWALVQLPAPWEEHSKYDANEAYGWFRRTLVIPAELKGRSFLLAVGWINEADETFVNGVKVGSSGTFPPKFRGAGTSDRTYPITPDLLKGDGTDTVAVRVYKHGGYGGGIFRTQMPHTRSGPFDTKAANGASLGYTLGGTAWYRKAFSVPAERKGGQVRIQFDGIYQNADVWLNGHHLGNHPYGYTSFGYDLAPHIKFGGENVIAVEVKNEGANSRWYSGSGIYRHVRLVLTGTAHVAQWGTFITTPEVFGGKAFVRIQTEVTGLSGTPEPLDLCTKIFDAAGKEVAKVATEGVLTSETTHRFDQRLEVTDPALWSLEHPTLYTAVSELAVARKVTDTTSQRFGIRTLHFSPEDGFKLNGEPLLLKGSCMHHDNGPLGAAAYDDAEIRRVRLTKEAGFNAIRCSHNPPSEAFLDACDQLGVLVIDEAFDIWQHGKGGSDFYAQHFDAWWQRDMDAMVLRDRNHPSIILWSIGNEIPLNDTDPVFETARMLAAYVRKIDPSRPVTAGVQGVNPKKDGYFAALDVAGYNYALKWNEGHTYQKNAYLDDHQRHPRRVIIGTESFASQAFDYWMPVVDYPWVIGDFVWTGWDYLGESSIGWIGFGYPVYWPVAYCGDISITGLRRPQSYYRGALFGDGKVAAFVMSPKPLFEHRRAFDWGFDDVQASWTWPGSEGKNLTVVVYSACDQVEVFLNDKSCGKQPTTRKERFQAHFGVPYALGTLKAIGYKDGRAVSEWKLETAGEPAALRLLPERTVLAADGQALAYIPFQVVDAAGRLHPQATNLVHFDIAGPAVLAAVGSGDPSSLESFQQPQRRAYQGQGLVILKSTREPGHIRLTATSKGLKPVSVEIDSK